MIENLKGIESIEITNVRHWTDRTFSFTCQRPKNFRFRSGEFVMIGLPNGNKPLLRAYSIASPSWDDELEFYSIKVIEGPLTSRLQKIKVGDQIYLRPKPVGTLVHDALLPGKRLILFSTGTGVAPFASIIRDPDTYEKYEEVVLTQTCREKNELDFGRNLIASIKNNELLSEVVANKLNFIATTTRETTDCMGRVTEWLTSGYFEKYTGAPLSQDTDRVMICGSLEMLEDHKEICIISGMLEGSNSKPGHFVIEKAFVD